MSKRQGNKQKLILGQRSDEYGSISQGRLSSMGIAQRDLTANWRRKDACSSRYRALSTAYLGRTIDMEEPEELGDAMSMMERELDITEAVTIEYKLVRLTSSLKCLKVEPLAISHGGPKRSVRNIEPGAQRHTYPKRSGIVYQSANGMMDRCWIIRAFCMSWTKRRQGKH
jgi:hypothetical protein